MCQQAMTNKTSLALYKQGHVLQVELSFNRKTSAWL
jgi:hypothetical protein